MRGGELPGGGGTGRERREGSVPGLRTLPRPLPTTHQLHGLGQPRQQQRVESFPDVLQAQRGEGTGPESHSRSPCNSHPSRGSPKPPQGCAGARPLPPARGSSVAGNFPWTEAFVSLLKAKRSPPLVLSQGFWRLLRGRKAGLPHPEERAKEARSRLGQQHRSESRPGARQLLPPLLGSSGGWTRACWASRPAPLHAGSVTPVSVSSRPTPRSSGAGGPHVLHRAPRQPGKCPPGPPTPPSARHLGRRRRSRWVCAEPPGWPSSGQGGERLS